MRGLGHSQTRLQTREGSNQAEALVARRYVEEMQNGLSGFGPFSSRRFEFLRVAYVPMVRGPAMRVELRPWDKDTSLQGFINAGFESGQLGQNQMASVKTRRQFFVNRDSRRNHESIEAPGVTLKGISAHYFLKARNISATSAAGHNPHIYIPGVRVNLNLGGYAGNLEAPYAEINNPRLERSAITITGYGGPVVHGAKTGNMLLDGKSVGGLAQASARGALDHATNWMFHPRDGVSYFPDPSSKSMLHAMTQHITLGSAQKTYDGLLQNAPYARRTAQYAHPTQGSVRPSRDHNRELELMYPRPTYAA